MSDKANPPARLRIIALDYGSAHTGVAVSDPTGTIARPLGEVDDAGSDAGLAAIGELVDAEGAGIVIVGIPISLSGELGAQARETQEFAERLASRLKVPVETWDERFTSKMARERGSHATAGEHSIAACLLLDDFLASERYRQLTAG